MSCIADLIAEHCPGGVERKALGDICIIKTGPNINKQLIAERPGPYPVINSGRDPLGYVDHYNTENDPIGIASRGSVGLVTWTPGRFFRGNLNYSCTVVDPALFDTRFLYHYLLHADAEIQALATHDGIPALNAGALKTLQVPAPPLAIQTEIVCILDAFTELTAELAAELTTELTARKKQYHHYRDQLLSFEKGEVKWTTLGDESFVEVANTARRPVKASLRAPGNHPYYGANNVQDYVDGYTHDGEYVLIAEDGSASLENYSIQYASGKFWANNHVHVVRGKSGLNTRFLYHYLRTVDFTPYLPNKDRAKLTKAEMLKVPVPFPYPENLEKSIRAQAELVRILDKLEDLSLAIRETLPREIELRQTQYAYYRDLLLSFPKPEEVAG